jgi:hypothetical protein
MRIVYFIPLISLFALVYSWKSEGHLMSTIFSNINPYILGARIAFDIL